MRKVFHFLSVLSFSFLVCKGVSAQTVPNSTTILIPDKTISITIMNIDSPTIDILNSAPFDEIALRIPVLLNGRLITKKEIEERAYQLRGQGNCKRRICPYLHVNNIYQNDVTGDEGRLVNFFLVWRRSLQFAKIMKASIIIDFTNKSVSSIAATQGIDVDETVKHLRNIGSVMALIVSEEYLNEVYFREEYPDVEYFRAFYYNLNIICLNSGHDSRLYPNEKYSMSSQSYVLEQFLNRLSSLNVAAKLIDGNNNLVANLDLMQRDIDRRQLMFNDWLVNYPNNFRLGSGIIVWDDPTKLTGWVAQRAGTNPQKSLVEFLPHLRKLYSNYHHVYFYASVLSDYFPFSEGARIYNSKLKAVLEQVPLE